MLEIKQLSKTFGNEQVLFNIDMSLETGKFYTFLGPSGCGKTTALRIIAGLETPDSQTKIYFEGKEITQLEPSKRGIGFVFQNYALFPHLTVYENINYGLKANRINRKEAEKRIREILEITRLSEHQNKRIDQLSGGQQQRVAIARSIVLYPNLLLLDEPMSNLDAELKESMLEALMDIQKRLNLTIIYVTHDQKEAMLISDEILLFSKGKLVQRGNNFELYHQPQNLFVANFIGDNHIHSKSEWQEILNGVQLGSSPYYALRSESIKLISSANAIPVEGIITRIRFYGAYAIVQVRIKNQYSLESFVVGEEIQSIMNLELGQKITLFINSKDFVRLEA